MLKSIIPGKLYWNKSSNYIWDKVICPVEVDAAYIEYYYVARPNKGLMYILPHYAKTGWEKIDENTDWQNIYC